MINHIHKRILRVVYRDFKSSFQELLTEGNSLNIHHIKICKNLWLKSLKLKMAYHLSSWMFSTFLKNHSSYKQISNFRSKWICATKYGIETPHLGPKLWNLVSSEYINFLHHLQILRQKWKLGFPRIVLAGYTKHIFTK